MTDQNVTDIIDKLNGYEISKKRCKIVTKPSTAYPKGKWFNGVVRFVYTERKLVSFIDDKLGIIDVYFSEIASPTDISEAPDRK